MEANELDRRLTELKERLAKLPAEDRDRALDGFAQVLDLVALARDAGDEASLSISLDRSSNIEYPSG